MLQTCCNTTMALSENAWDGVEASQCLLARCCTNMVQCATGEATRDRLSRQGFWNIFCVTTLTCHNKFLATPLTNPSESNNGSLNLNQSTIFQLALQVWMLMLTTAALFVQSSYRGFRQPCRGSMVVCGGLTTSLWLQFATTRPWGSFLLLGNISCWAR